MLSALFFSSPVITHILVLPFQPALTWTWSWQLLKKKIDHTLGFLDRVVSSISSVVSAWLFCWGFMWGNQFFNISSIFRMMLTYRSLYGRRRTNFKFGNPPANNKKKKKTRNYTQFCVEIIWHNRKLQNARSECKDHLTTCTRHHQRKRVS